MIYQFVILLIIGIGLFIGSIALFCHIKKWYKNGKIVFGTIISICRDRVNSGINIIVEYEINGKRYERNLGTYVIGMRKGQRIPILYKPDDPTKITYVKGNWILFAILVIFGIAAIAGAFFTLL